MGSAAKITTSAANLSVSEALKRLAFRRRPPHCSRWTRRRMPPAVTESREILDFGKVSIDGSEFIANTLYRRADVRPISILAAAGDEADAVHAVVDRAVRHVLACV